MTAGRAPWPRRGAARSLGLAHEPPPVPMPETVMQPDLRRRTAGAAAGRGAPVRALLLPAFVLLLAACAGGEDGTAAGSDRGGTAVIGVVDDASTVLPPLARTSLDQELGGLLFPGLNRLAWSEDGPSYVTGDSVALAESWRFGPDSTTLVYRLADGRRWSDGEPVTAADVVFTYRLLADDEAGLPLSYVTGEMDSVTARGDTAVAFHFARRHPRMLFDTGVGILPEHVYGDVPAAEFSRVAGAAAGAGDADTARAARGHGAAVASGPFRLAEWRRGDRIVLVRNTGAPAPSRLDTLVLRVLPEEATRLAELRAGGLDMARVEAFDEASRLAERPGYEVQAVPDRAYDYVAWNPGGHPAFDDLAVRRALSVALDREEMLSALEMAPFAEPARGPYGPLFPHLADALPEIAADRERARRLLDEAGWSVPPEGDVRERGGERMAFDLLVPAGSDRRTTAAVMIQEQLAEVGVEVRVRTREFNALFEAVRAGEYQAALLGWQVALDPDISPFWYDPSSPLNVVSFDSPRARALMDSALAAPTAEAAARHWRSAGREIAGAHPYAFLWYFDLPWVVGPGLRGVDVDVTGFAAAARRWRVGSS